PRAQMAQAVPIPLRLEPEAQVREIISRYQVAPDFGVNADSRMAQRVLEQLAQLQTELDQLPTTGAQDREQALQNLLERILPTLREEHRQAQEANFTKLEPWIGGMIEELDSVRVELSKSTINFAQP